MLTQCKIDYFFNGMESEEEPMPNVEPCNICGGYKNIPYGSLCFCKEEPKTPTSNITQQENLEIFKKILQDRITMIEGWNADYLAKDNGRITHSSIITHNNAEVLALKIAIRVADRVFVGGV